MATGGPPLKLTPEVRAAFLEHLAKSGQVYRSAAAVGVSPSAIRQLRLRDAGFQEEFDEALGRNGEFLERVAMRRAVRGWVEPVYQGGIQVGRVRRFDNRLLEFLMRHRIPSYREKSGLDITMSGGVLVVSGMAKNEDVWRRETGADSGGQHPDQRGVGAERRDG